MDAHSASMGAKVALSLARARDVEDEQRLLFVQQPYVSFRQQFGCSHKIAGEWRPDLLHVLMYSVLGVLSIFATRASIRVAAAAADISYCLLCAAKACHACIPH